MMSVLLGMWRSIPPAWGKGLRAKNNVVFIYAEDWPAEASYIAQQLKATSETFLLDAMREAFLGGAQKYARVT